MGTPTDLTEASLGDMLRQIKEMSEGTGKQFAIRPTHRIVSPAEYRRIMQARNRERLRTWWEKIWDRILPA